MNFAFNVKKFNLAGVNCFAFCVEGFNNMFGNRVFDFDAVRWHTLEPDGAIRARLHYHGVTLSRDWRDHNHRGEESARKRARRSEERR